MARHTHIEWCDSTFNPWIGCTRLSPACDDCFAARSTPARTMGIVWGPHEPRHRTSESTWRQPIRWNAKPFYACQTCAWRGDAPGIIEFDGGTTHPTCPDCTGNVAPARRRVFCASLADVFDNAVPPEWRHELFEMIRLTPTIDWLLLTKRPQNIVRMVQDHGAIAGNGTRFLPDNAWLGTTCEDQVRANQNLPALLRTRAELGASTLFVSVEPMLTATDLTRIVVHKGAIAPEDPGPADWDSLDVDAAELVLNALRPSDVTGQRRLDWVICGGESGPKARPMHPAWARGLRDQCAAAKVPFLFKQWGEFAPSDEGLARNGDVVHEHGVWSVRVGKKAAGRRLDGREHNAFPVPR